VKRLLIQKKFYYWKRQPNVSYALQVIEKDALRKKAEEEVSKVKGATTLTQVSPVGIFRSMLTV
jgi:hypothetical protein